MEIIRFRSLFQNISERGKYEPPLKECSPCFDSAINVKELLERQEKIDRAILFRIKRQENTFVHVIEADPKDIFLLHKDKWPFYNQRMRLWGKFLYRIFD